MAGNKDAVLTAQADVLSAAALADSDGSDDDVPLAARSKQAAA